MQPLTKTLKKWLKRNFREDLYFRLNVIPIYLPPLRERKEDIPLLIDHFLKKFNQEYGKNISISRSAMEKLINYSWPGNVRELENTIERLVILVEGTEITFNDFPFYIRQDEDVKIVGVKLKNSLPSQIEFIKKRAIEETLKACIYNQKKSAKMLGLTKKQINYKIKKYSLIIK